jgi:nitroreductase
MMVNDFTKAMDFRHACKIFDEDKKISDEDIHYILEMGRKSPSSFGLEGWKFLVITNEELKKRLRVECWNQVQITSCSHLVVLLAEIEGTKVESGKPKTQLGRRGMSEDKLQGYVKLYASHLADTLSSDEKIYEWSARQTYIAGANMMTAAAFIGIDSCPIEGMDRAKVENILGLDTKKWQVSMLLPFGYRIKEQQKQIRLSFDEVVEFID